MNSLIEKLIQPKEGEDKNAYISRFMKNDKAIEEFPNNKQRFAVCMSYWDKHTKNESLNSEYKYECKSFFQRKNPRDYVGLEDEFGTNNVSEAEDWIWQKIQSGSYCTMYQRDEDTTVYFNADLFTTESESPEELTEAVTNNRITRKDVEALNKICRKYCGWHEPKEIAHLWSELEEAGVDPFLITGYPDDIAPTGAKSWTVIFSINGETIDNSRFIYSVYEGTEDSRNEYNIYFS